MAKLALQRQHMNTHKQIPKEGDKRVPVMRKNKFSTE
jgi:hypothetical protein